MSTQSNFPNYFSFLDASTRRVFEEASKYQALIDKAAENIVSTQVEKYSIAQPLLVHCKTKFFNNNKTTKKLRRSQSH